MIAPLVSIVLPTRNGARTLPATLDAIARQRSDFAFELVAIDSGSTDGTPRLLERAGWRVIGIPPQSFNHGTTRNLAVEAARGQLIVLLVQDAVPASDDWLARLVAPLRIDARVAGTFCRQQPHPGATVIARRYASRWVAASPTPRTVWLESPAQLDRLEPYERLRLCAFDNVCSCIRRSVWQMVPFARTPIAEDLEWGRAVLLAGYRLTYVPDAVVLHSHDRGAWYEFVRTYTLHRQLYRLFRLRTIPDALTLAKAIASSARLHLACEREARQAGEGRAGVWPSLALAVARPVGQYLGGWTAETGWARSRARRRGSASVRAASSLPGSGSDR